MSDFKEISDLSPAPRRTPTAVLWTMAAVVLAGSGALVWSVPANDRAGASRSVQTRGHYAAAAPAAQPSAKSKPAFSPAR